MLMTSDPSKLEMNKAMQITEAKLDSEIFKKPEVPKLKQKVLEENEYVEAIGRIIERDFFPDLEKLKVQNEYLEAIEKNDVTKLRQLYAKYSGKKPVNEREPSPATFDTPVRNDKTLQDLLEDNTHSASRKTEAPKLSLDKFLSTHTSQDNGSFTEILQEAAKKHLQKFSYLYQEEERFNEELQKSLTLPSVEEQRAPPKKKFALDSWAYKNRNYIMFVPESQVATKEDKLATRKRHEILHSNTRLMENPFNESQNQEVITELAKVQAKVLDGKIGIDGKELLKGRTPNIGGFSFVSTPSPNPGATGSSPFMTWGEIEGTPFRLDAEGMSLPKVYGPSFKMSEPAIREKLALALADKSSEKRVFQRKSVIHKGTATSTITSAFDRLATMSPAAKRLATTGLKLGTGTTKRLSSPFLASPSHARKQCRIATPKLAPVAKPKLNNDNLTDDLLNIGLPKRCKAADFFD